MIAEFVISCDNARLTPEYPERRSETGSICKRAAHDWLKWGALVYVQQ